ncbi:hypothetical protein BLS_004418 [Venturia inaequalis]|uniref:Mediator of RNA polymerase II transcription subunit 13 n=1 Tax=Venturia inaequalis TaxID=5025 RepID=A0A8H3V482_VENIN|nr:hypothetical protein BLS_004418 [Venturia inaequalis]KAE9980781.1 hypothetical protein EG328_012029 [Venturia inaequalis]KAE9990366.1 hypothetical protein EG327_001504 [Venturia inaequalis]
MSLNTTAMNATDLLKSCPTGVQILANLETIMFQTLTIEMKDDAEEEGQGEAIAAAIATLRAWSFFAYLESSKRVLWIFHGGSLTNGFATRPDITKIAQDWPFQLKNFHKGSFKASEVSTSRPPPSAPNAPPESCIPISKVTPAIRHAQMMLQKSLKALAAPTGTAVDPGIIPTHIQAVYSKFISAVYLTVSHKLARDDRWIEVNPSTYVQLPEDWNVRKDTPLQCFSLDIYLAGGGQLVISTNTLEDSTFWPCYELDSYSDTLEPILLAPGGMPAVVNDDCIAPENKASQIWKETVSNLLATRGIQLNVLDPAIHWVLVRAWPSATTADSDTTLGTVFYWPRALCFRTSPPASDGSQSTFEFEDQLEDPTKISPSSWFYSAKEGGFLDSLQFAEDWFGGKVERDKIVQERQKKRKEMEAAVQKQVEPAALAVASPFYTRGDLQAAGGMYPTPPDGVISQPGTVPASADAIPAIAAHDTPVPRTGLVGDGMDMDEMFGETLKRRATIESRNSIQMDVDMDRDDLFDAIDEDEFTGHDIIDADFDFFDEPDDDMLGAASSVPDVPTKAPPIHEPQVIPIAAIQPSHPPPEPDLFSALEQAMGSTNEVAVPEPDAPKQAPDQTPAAVKVEAIIMKPPLSPTSVRKKLFDETANDHTISRRRGSQYDPVPFKPSLVSEDTKYSTGGTFGFSEKEIADLAKHSTARTETDIALPPRKRPRTRRRQPKDSDESSDTSDASDDDSLSDEIESLALASSPVKGIFFDKRITALQDGDVTSVATSPGSYMAIEDHPASGMSGSLQDRIELLDAILNAPSSTIPPSALVRQPNESDGMFMLNPTDLPVTLASTTALDGPLSLSNKDFILVAQIIAEQLIFSSIDHSLQLTTEGQGMMDALPVKSYSITTARAAQTALKSFHSGLTDCDFFKFLCLSDHDRPQGAKGQPQPQAKKVSPQAAEFSIATINALTTLPPPHVRVRRNEGLWDILPPAIPFWEHLGLAPASGRKNLMAFCIYPGGQDVKSQVCLFMENLGASYESCKLGAHFRSDVQKSAPIQIEQGLVPVTLTDQDESIDLAIRRMREVCVDLGKHLSTLDTQQKKSTSTPANEEPPPIDNFIIYMVNPFTDGRGIAELCAAFWMLYKAYSPPRSPQLDPRPDLVLQIIPIADVANPSTPVIHSSLYFQQMARRVYDRCPPSRSFHDSDPTPLRIVSASSVLLESPIPKKIGFLLSTDPPADLLNDQPHLHVAYAISENGEWVTAALTCLTGRYQTTVSYCLAGGRPFWDVAREIWSVALSVMRERRGAWRLCVVRVGRMTCGELDAWSSLHSSPAPFNIIVCIMSIDPSPPVTIFPPASSPSTLPLIDKSTPVSTPQPGISPDPHALTPASTPSANVDSAAADPANDKDAHLVDRGDEVFGLISGCRVNILGGKGEYRLSLSTGYMFRSPAACKSRPGVTEGFEGNGSGDVGSGGGVKDERVGLVGVHLIWVGQPPRGGVQAQQAQQQQQQNQQGGAQQSQQGGQGFSPIDPSLPQTPGASIPANEAGQRATMTTTNQPQIHRSMADSILKDYLVLFRNLAELARVRGVGDGDGVEGEGVLPWHCLVALRGVRGLQRTFGNLNDG